MQGLLLKVIVPIRLASPPLAKLKIPKHDGLLWDHRALQAEPPAAKFSSARQVTRPGTALSPPAGGLAQQSQPRSMSPVLVRFAFCLLLP